MSFVPLNIKTNNYLLKSMIKIKELVKIAKDNNIPALTITDNNMYGVLDFYKECKNNNIKPIVGLEININDLKIILYSINYKGYQNLIKLSTIMSNENLTLDILDTYQNNLICIVPYQSRRLYKDLNKIYNYIFIGYQNEEEKQKIKSTNIVFLNEILCINKEDEKYLKYLKAIKEGTLAENIEEIVNSSLLPLKNLNEKNNERIFDLCNLEIEFHQKLMPKINENSPKLLKDKCVYSLKQIFGQKAPKKYVERLKYELNTINQMGFSDYFLIVADYIKYAKENDILVGPGRGSAAGSLVSYLLNITTIDPLKYDLLFERFLNPERITMPDIDVDFEDLKRDKVIEYCINKYGEKKVAPIITFGTLGPRQVLKDVGRVLDIQIKKLDILCKMIDPRISLTQNYNQKRVKDFLEINKELKKVYKIALKFEGLKRHTSIHAAGVVMSDTDLDEVIPLDKNHNFYTTAYDMTYLEEIGLLKMDFLALSNLTLISKIIKEIKELSFDTIKENDQKTFQLFQSANTIGIFQFESDGMINFLRKFKPNSFNDLVAALALFRPGPMQNIDTYIRRKQGKEKIDYIHKDLEDILKPTFGIIIYQEQIMQIASTMAGYTLAEADILRRAMSKKKEDVLLKEKDKFINKSINKGYAKEKAEEVYNLILKFANYGFNKSHSVAYAMISYKMAYLKAHYPKIFIKNLLDSAINSEKKTMDYIYESKLNNINVSLPDINKSTNNYIIDNENIIYPLSNIKNIGTIATNTILEERGKGLFKDIFDFVKRCYGKAVTSKVIENLILAGAFDKLGYNRKTLIENLEVILNYSEIGELLGEDAFKPELTIKEEYSKNELMNWEKEIFGFYISNHPITEYKLKNKNNIELKNINHYFDKMISTIIYVDKIKIINTKKGDKMMFITGSDEITKIDLVAFPTTYNKYQNIEKGDILEINGRVEKRFDKMQIVINDLKKLK